MSHSIPLGQGQVTLVDDDVFPQVSRYQWFLSGTGYAAGFVPTGGQFKLVYLHRWLMQAGDGQQVDHINGDRLDNRRNNLRLVTPQQNGQNKRLSIHSSTRLKGVCWHKDRRKYHARIQLQGIRYHLGFFDDPQMAALAYDAAARWLFGAFAVATIPLKRLHNLWPFSWPSGLGSGD